MEISYSKISNGIHTAQRKIYITRRRIIMPAIRRSMETSSYANLVPKKIKNTAKTVKIAAEGYMAHCPKWMKKTLKTSGDLYLAKIAAGCIVLAGKHTGLPPDCLISVAKSLHNFSKTFAVFVKSCR